MCLDPIFTPTLPPQGASVVNHGPDLSFHFAYFELLDHLRREYSLDADSVRQKVFAFQKRPDDRFFIPANTFLHAGFVSKTDIVQEKGGCVVTHEELRRVLDYKIPDYVRLRGKQQNDAYRRRLGAAPCLTMITRGDCPKADCQFQHLRSEKITAAWFNDRVQLVLKEIQILNLAGFHPIGAIMCVSRCRNRTDSDLVGTATGSVSFTLSYTPWYQSSGLLQYSILGTCLIRRKGSEFCENGYGRHVTNSCSAHHLRRSGTLRHLSPSLCLFVPWRTTSTSSERKLMSLARGCAVKGGGHCASRGRGSRRRGTLLSGTSFSFCKVVPTIR